MKQGWEIKKLEEVCDFKSGTTIARKLEKNEGEIIYAKVGDMNLPGNEDFITVSSRYVNLNEINANQIIPNGSIIFPKRGGAIATNKKRRIKKPTIVDLNTMALVPSKIIDKDYLYFWFQQIDLSKLSNGTSIPQINNYSFENVYISFPNSLTEQQRIVALLDEAFAAIAKAKANTEQNLKNAKELFENYLQSVFERKGDSLEVKQLNDVIKKTETVDPTKDPDKSFKYIDVSSVDNKKFEIISTSLVKGKDAPSRARKLIKTNDIIFATVRPTLKRVVIITKDYNDQVCSTGYFVLRAKDFIDHRLIFYFLLTKKFIDQMDKLQKGASYPAVTDGDVKSQLIPFPKSFTEQKAIVIKLDALSEETKKLEAIYHQKLNDLEELKKSILQKAFAGELRVGDLVDPNTGTIKTL